MKINNELMKKLFTFIEYYPENDSIDIELIGKSSDILPNIDTLESMKIESDYINVESKDTGIDGFSISINNGTNSDDSISIWYSPANKDTLNLNIMFPVTLYIIDEDFYNIHKNNIHNRFNIQNIDYTFLNAVDRIDERIWYIISQYHVNNKLNRNITYRILNHFESRDKDWYSGIINNGENRDDNKSCIFASIESIIDNGNNDISYKTKAFICGDLLTTDQSGYYEVFINKV